MEQYNNKEGIEESMEIERLRFGMIAPVIQETYPDESIMAYCRRVSKIKCHPDPCQTGTGKPDPGNSICSNGSKIYQTKWIEKYGCRIEWQGPESL